MSIDKKAFSSDKCFSIADSFGMSWEGSRQLIEAYEAAKAGGDNSSPTKQQPDECAREANYLVEQALMQPGDYPLKLTRIDLETIQDALAMPKRESAQPDEETLIQLVQPIIERCLQWLVDGQPVQGGVAAYRIINALRPYLWKPEREVVDVASQEMDALEWLKMNHPEVFEEQKHLDEGTKERAYWHYGRWSVLKDIRRRGSDE